MCNWLCWYVNVIDLSGNSLYKSCIKAYVDSLIEVSIEIVLNLKRIPVRIYFIFMSNKNVDLTSYAFRSCKF